ncbi:zeta toxin family protein [uncultured Corynebacterium sp.]|uniref:zeta toxin family protein n=1 Tax=uncultured Corynebacterium sp. TaxID=159447 RepID=UPI0025F34DDA|nr:zeta toxin family protein [uncultured Corynebacterium sp.]
MSQSAQEPILADLLLDVDTPHSASPSPTLVVVTGQPAAGKSRTIDRISAALDTPAVVLDSDVLRLNHPAMPDIMERDPQRMDVLSNGPVGFWMSGVIDHCRQHRYNIIIENTLTNPKQVSETAQLFHDTGFAVAVAALAVHEEVSRLGIVSRYLAGIDTDAFPRWTTERSHTTACHGMVSGLATINGSVDTIEVYDRQGHPLYAGSNGTAAAEAVTRERTTPLTDRQIQEWTTDYLRALPRLSDPAIVTAQTRTVLTNVVADAERIFRESGTEALPVEHHQLKELLTSA